MSNGQNTLIPPTTLGWRLRMAIEFADVKVIDLAPDGSWQQLDPKIKAERDASRAAAATADADEARTAAIAAAGRRGERNVLLVVAGIVLTVVVIGVVVDLLNGAPPPKTQAASPATTAAPSMAAWASRMSPKIDALSSTMSDIGLAAKSGSGQSMQNECQQMAEDIADIRAELPSPDRILTGYLTDALDDYSDAAAGCITGSATAKATDRMNELT